MRAATAMLSASTPTSSIPNRARIGVKVDVHVFRDAVRTVASSLNFQQACPLRPVPDFAPSLRRKSPLCRDDDNTGQAVMASSL